VCDTRVIAQEANWKKKRGIHKKKGTESLKNTAFSIDAGASELYTVEIYFDKIKASHLKQQCELQDCYHINITYLYKFTTRKIFLLLSN